MSAAQIVTRLILAAIQSEEAQKVGRYVVRQATAAIIRHIQGATSRRQRSVPTYR